MPEAEQNVPEIPKGPAAVTSMKLGTAQPETKPHPLFNPQTWSEKTQQAQASKNSRAKKKTQSVMTTTSEEPEPSAATATKPRKPRAKAPRDGRRKKKNETEPSIPPIAPASTAVDPVVAPAVLITPESPPNSEMTFEKDGVDLNHGRRKRRKKTPPVLPVNIEVDLDTPMDEALPVQKTQCTATTTTGDENLQVGGGSPVNSTLTARKSPRIQAQSLLEKAKQPSTSTAPSLTNAFSILGKKKKVATLSCPNPPKLPGRKSPCSYDEESVILTIRSSPILISDSPPNSPASPDPISLPGNDGTLILPLAPTIENAARRKRVTYNRKSGILSIQSSPVLKPEDPAKNPVPTNAFNLLGKGKDTAPSEAKALAHIPKVTVKEAPKKVAVSQPTKPVHPFFKPGGPKKAHKVDPPVSAPQSDVEEDASFLGFSSSTKNWPSSSSRLSGGTSNAGFGVGGSGGSERSLFSPATNRVLKTPGLIDAPWRTLHARGLSAEAETKFTPNTDQKFTKAERKLKDKKTTVSSDENILTGLSHTLGINKIKEEILAADYNEKRYYRIPPDVRLPKRIVTTGSELQEMVRPRVSARLPHPNATGSAEFDRDRSASVSSRTSIGPRRAHPALTKLYDRLKDNLTPFDLGECETQAWEVKYAPQSSSEVLQTGRETSILKDWLVGLKVESVGGGHSEGSGVKRKSRAVSGAKGAPAKKKKRKRKDDELAGFLVDSEEEKNEMDELTDPEDNDWLSVPVPGLKKSTIRSGDKNAEGSSWGYGKEETRKTVNSVVVSGPSGCGKTAAVYAAAKEAGFTVFEVSPGTRRSGKDILDQVGEMSRTHLVHQAKAASALEGSSFFKQKQTQKVHGQENIPPKAAQQQQQSLILLEEADILFEEDKQFWSTVLALMAQSKRPIVLTCNDETLLPMETLPLHAVLRFAPPPRELVVDCLLLMCANEGHLLRRSAVDGLVQSMKGDLRASLVELEFWCRLSVGDRKGGLDWMIIRWPPGVGVAENGEALRVVSKDTYQKGMGWYQRGDVWEHEKWRSVWEGWEMDIGGEAGIVGTVDWADGLSREGAEGDLALEAWERYIDALSAVDVYAGSGMRGADEPVLDATQPPLPWKSRVDDLQGYKILQADPVVKLYSVETQMATYIRSTARKHLESEANCLSTNKISRLGDKELARMVVERKTIQDEFRPIPQNQLQETFTPLSYPPTVFASTPATMHSSIYRPLSILTLDVAPYVREIVRFDIMNEEARVKHSNLLSAGGNGKKRATRAARVAEQGGDRGRKERWFAGLNGRSVIASGGSGWGDLVNVSSSPSPEVDEIDMDLDAEGDTE